MSDRMTGYATQMKNDQLNVISSPLSSLLTSPMTSSSSTMNLSRFHYAPQHSPHDLVHSLQTMSLGSSNSSSKLTIPGVENDNGSKSKRNSRQTIVTGITSNEMEDALSYRTSIARIHDQNPMRNEKTRITVSSQVIIQPSDASLTQSETQPATLQMTEFDDDDCAIDEGLGANTNTNGNNNNRSRRQPTCKTWISPFPSRNENLYFFMFRYKVHGCPYRRNCSEKVICELYHHDGERRRNPGFGPKFLYSEEACQQVKPVGSVKWLPQTRCANGDKCQYSHTILEQMYHPNIYKTSMCMNYTNPSGNRCKWGYYCTHAHGQPDIRPPVNRRVNTTNHIVPLGCDSSSTLSQQQQQQQQQHKVVIDMDKHTLHHDITHVYPIVSFDGNKIKSTQTQKDIIQLRDTLEDRTKENEEELLKFDFKNNVNINENDNTKEKWSKTIGQSTTSVVDDLGDINFSITKATHKIQQRETVHWPNSLSVNATCSNALPYLSNVYQSDINTNTKILNTNTNSNGKMQYGNWNDPRSHSNTNTLNTIVDDKDANTAAMLLWSGEKESEFYGQLLHLDAKCDPIALSDTDNDSELGGLLYPFNIPFTPSPPPTLSYTEKTTIPNKHFSKTVVHPTKTSRFSLNKSSHLLIDVKKHTCEGCGNMPQEAMQVLTPCDHVLCKSCHQNESKCSLCHTNVFRTLIYDYR